MCMYKWDQVEKKHCADTNAPEPISEDINSFCCSTSCSAHSVDYHGAQAVQNWFRWLPHEGPQHFAGLEMQIQDAFCLSARMGPWHVPSCSESLFFSHWRKTETWKQRSLLHSAVPPSGWLWHAQMCSRSVLLVAEWYSGTHSLSQPRAKPSNKGVRERLSLQLRQAAYSSCLGELSRQGSC